MDLIQTNPAAFQGNSMALAFQKANFKLKTSRVFWPRTKGPKAVRVDVATGTAVAFLNPEKKMTCKQYNKLMSFARQPVTVDWSMFGLEEAR